MTQAEWVDWWFSQTYLVQTSALVELLNKMDTDDLSGIENGIKILKIYKGAAAGDENAIRTTKRFDEIFAQSWEEVQARLKKSNYCLKRQKQKICLFFIAPALSFCLLFPLLIQN